MSVKIFIKVLNSINTRASARESLYIAARSAWILNTSSAYRVPCAKDRKRWALARARPWLGAERAIVYWINAECINRETRARYRGAWGYFNEAVPRDTRRGPGVGKRDEMQIRASPSQNALRISVSHTVNLTFDPLLPSLVYSARWGINFVLAAGLDAYVIFAKILDRRALAGARALYVFMRQSRS